MEFPFTQEKYDGYTIRVFSKDVETDELKWHYDLENRTVTILEGDDWEFQMDNQLPQILKSGQVLTILKGVYHRVKRGTTDLKIKIETYE